MNSCLQYVSLMIPFIYFKLLKYTFGMFYNKIYFIFYNVKPPQLAIEGKKYNSDTKHITLQDQTYCFNYCFARQL